MYNVGVVAAERVRLTAVHSTRFMTAFIRRWVEWCPGAVSVSDLCSCCPDTKAYLCWQFRGGYVPMNSGPQLVHRP